jgi:hypothetical protein
MNAELKGLIEKWRALQHLCEEIPAEVPFAASIFKRFADELEQALAAPQAAAPPTPGEDAWLDELAWAHNSRDKLRTILRAYRANLLTRAPSEGGAAQLAEAKWWHERIGLNHGMGWCCERIAYLESLPSEGGGAGLTVDVRLLTEKDVAQAYQCAPRWESVLRSLQCSAARTALEASASQKEGAIVVSGEPTPIFDPQKVAREICNEVFNEHLFDRESPLQDCSCGWKAKEGERFTLEQVEKAWREHKIKL